MASVDMNKEYLHSFIKGWQKDLDEHFESNECYNEGENGRLLSENGNLSYAGVQGTLLIYQNADIVKYLGGYAFKDELIVFGKCSADLNPVETEDKIIKEIIVSDFELSSNTNLITGVDFSDKYEIVETTVQVPVVPIDEDDFKQNFSEVNDVVPDDPTFGNLFKTIPYLPATSCSISENDVPINNVDYKDFVISFKYDEVGQLHAEFKYIGYLNFPMNSKITCEGIDENIYYKRVYFSDYYNPTRVINLKDKNLSTRKPEEFDFQPKGTLLSPRIKSIDKNGQLKAMTVFYAMRLVTENGQVSDYSAVSPGVKIAKGTNDFDFSGGSTSETTNKSVKVNCYIPDYENFKDVQLISVEYEAKDVPTTIRLVGTKPVNSVVEFEHFGSESEFIENITLSDLFKNSISWKYNSDFSNKNNKLLVSGLRNDPLYINSKNIALDFSLKSFSPTGETHDSLLNPDPEKYNYINNNFNQTFFYVQRKLFRKIEVFGNFKMKLENTATGEFFEFEEDIVEYNYIDYTAAIADFLVGIQSGPNFSTKFPNLAITKSGTKILFSPVNESIITDFFYYNLTFTTTQVIIDYDNDIENKNIPWPTSDYQKDNALVYGAVSNGWFQGNGVKITMHTERENILSKNTDWIQPNSNAFPLQIKTPSLQKYVMKGEIYRLGIQWFKNGTRLFTTILGDIKIPDIGMRKRELNENNQIIVTNEVYSNWIVVGNEMYSEGIKLQFDVRINCELSKEVDAYQIVYVERTENNRTILAQGISSPLERMNTFEIYDDVRMDIQEIVDNKWNLPSHGGPVYDYYGLKIFDKNPDSTALADTVPGMPNSIPKRIVTNRRSFYFDSPDLIYNKISSNFVSSCKIEYIETVATDHDRHNILGGYSYESTDVPGTQVYDQNGNKSDRGPVGFGAPKFSQKIPWTALAGSENEKPNFVNVSVFSNRLKRRSYSAFQQTIDPSYLYEIDKAASANHGEVLSGYKINESFDVSNNALVLAAQGWYYQETARGENIPKYTLFAVNNIASGRNTVFIKTKNNLFTDENINQIPYIIYSQVNFGTSNGRKDTIKGNDAYIVSNLKRNNADSVYGGRSEFAYSVNEYIPLTEVFPIITNRIASQLFYAQGDTYCNLYIRDKSTYINALLPGERNFQWSKSANADDDKQQYNKYGAWCYAVVLESTVEPRFNHSAEFYKFSNSINFNYEEVYNSAYLQENNLRKSIPNPYNFKDDPILNNIIAASVTKLTGDTIDAWTQFLTNEFYELDKNKGSALNIYKQQDDIYVIQELQTSKLMIDERSFITPDGGGDAIQVGQGNGASISGHNVISEFGTSFRRAIIASPYGFIFYDERKSEMVQLASPLFIQQNLFIYLKEFFIANKVIDVEGYYDDKHKESNIRFRTEQNINFVISYNELLKCFNGKIMYDNDLYFTYQNNVIAPYQNSVKLGELNKGNELEFFEVKHNLRIKVVSAPEPDTTKINKGIAIFLNTNYPIISAIFETSLGNIRSVLGTHHWYKIREGIHTIPAKNETDHDDIRGEWCSIDISVESKENKKVRIFSIKNFFRTSYK